MFVVLLTDQLTKFTVVNALSYGQSIPVISGIFHITLVRNSGIAFGLFRNYPWLLLALITASLGILFLLAGKVQRQDSLVRYAFALILGGAIGNWVDRMRFGVVIDFLDFRFWPVFNIADSAITVGVGMYFISLLKKGRRE